MRIAIVHDYLNQYGGAEKVVEVLHKLYPEAPVFTTIYDKKKMPDLFTEWDIRTSFMQHFPFLDNHFKKYLLFYPKAIESFDLKEFDLVLSSSSSFAKGAIKEKGACHVCYCHTPMRFAWDYDRYIKRENIGVVFKKVLPLAIKKLRNWDLKTLSRVDYFISNSEYIKEKLKKYYNRSSKVIYPPINVREFKQSSKIEDYFLIVSRLTAYKNIDLVIDVFNDLNLKLKIVGGGPYKAFLESIVKTQNIEFLGRLEDNELKEVYSRCRAFIFPGIEDFGICPVEAQASGRPVIALGAGGALETVIEGVTGIFFPESSKDSLKDAILRFLKIEDKFEQKDIIKNAFRFDEDIFKNKITECIEEKYREYFRAE